MQGILRYSMHSMHSTVAEGGLAIDRATATGLVDAYGSGVYLSTILGAWLADRLLGSEKVLFFSASMIMLRHASLAVLPGCLGLSVGLVLVGVGSGGLKANATSLVGTLCAEGDERRDAGFSIFYRGINTGALIGPLLTGWLQVTYGFHIGFGAAAVGMAIGLTQHALTRKNLPAAAHDVTNSLPQAQRARWAGIASIAIIIRSPRIDATERSRVLSFIPLHIASVAFWALLQQQLTVVAISSEQGVGRTILGWTMPPRFVQSINPIFIIVFAGVFAAVWTKLGSRQPSSPLKLAAGLVVMGLAFLAVIPFSGSGLGGTPLLALVGILPLLTFAELFLSPIWLSVATKLAPAAFRTQMVALFFPSVSVGTTLAGILAGYDSTEKEVPSLSFIGITAIVMAWASRWPPRR